VIVILKCFQRFRYSTGYFHNKTIFGGYTILIKVTLTGKLTHKGVRIMATTKQRQAAKRNIKKAQAVWKSMSSRAHARRQPEGRARQRPGAGGGEFYRVEVRPKTEFVTFRTQDVGKKGDIERLAGKRKSGSWDTQAWLISKDSAHVARGKLVADTRAAEKVLMTLGSPPKHIGGLRFKARPTPNIPERAKPTTAMRRAQMSNIRKAQAVRWR